MYARGYNTQVLGIARFVSGTVRSVRPWHNTRSFWKFCKTSVPVPGASGSFVDLHTHTRNFCDFSKTDTIPGVQVYLCYNTGGALYFSGLIRRVYYAL